MNVEEIRKEIESIRITAQVLIESAAKLEERLAEGVSTPSIKSGVNDKKINQAVLRRRTRIMNSQRVNENHGSKTKAVS
jgi:hypothetical protein